VDSIGRRVRFLHPGRIGPSCSHHHTFLPVVYAALYDPVLRLTFCNTPYDTLGLQTSSEEDLAAWLFQPSSQRDITNLMTVVEFIVEIRGMP